MFWDAVIAITAFCVVVLFGYFAICWCEEIKRNNDE